MEWKIIIPVAAAAVVLIIIALTGYVKAPTDRAFIISGFRKKPRVLIGRAGVKIPFLERKDELILKQISIDIKTNGYIPTKDFIGVDIDAVAKIRVLTENDISAERGITEEMAGAAMKNFLNMKEEQIRQALTDSLQGNMREIIGTQTLKNLCNDRKTFGDEVQSKAQKDMNALGIWIESCNIQKIEDENNLINALGQDNMSQIQKDASIAKAQADRDVAVAKAEASKAANDAEVAAQTEIAAKQNELAIRKAELKKTADIKQAEADAAYRIQEQEQRRSIEIANTNADIGKQEREVELKKKEAEVREQQLAAEVRKTAEAERYRVQQKSDAELYRRQKDAEAKKYEEQQAAEIQRIKAEAKKFEEQQAAEAAKAQADAMKYRKEQEAAGIAAVGEAEAKAIQAKGLAEAEALEKKAEAMKKYGQAAILEMIVKALPEIAGAVARPLESIDKVTIIDGGGSGTGVNSMGSYVPSVMAKTFESVKEVTGVDLTEIMRAETYDARVNRNVSITGSDEVLPAITTE
ncbi:MAG: flotillin family protein [Oscillospiraceae bacterium]|nr:flotillin family protein [Oscillospiraceae bacterium]